MASSYQARAAASAGDLPDRSETAFLFAVLAVAALVVFSRRPDAFTNPQFYAEDGIWYADAHERGGLQALLTPYRGYFVTVQRLGGWLAQLFPLRAAPAVLNAVALVVQTLPAVLVSSRRWAGVVPGRRARMVAALFYLALPNSWSTISNLTHAQWHLAALACFVVVACAADRPSWRLFDVAALTLSGLSGPFAIFLTPIAALAAWRERSRWRLAVAALVAATAVVQVAALVHTGTLGGTVGRPALGASLGGFFSLWTKQVVYGAFLGQRGLEGLAKAGDTAWLRPTLLFVCGSTALAVIVRAASRGGFEHRALLAMAASILVAALSLPPITPLPLPYWESISYPGAGNRYYLLAIFGLAGSFASLLGERLRLLRLVGALALVGIAAAVALDWRQPAMRDYEFARYVRKYERARPGEQVQIPHPPSWGILLTRRN